MVRAYRNYNTAIPQSQPLTPDQVVNNAGGFVYELDPWKQLDRFLILGSEGNTYYVSEQKLTRDNARNVLKLIEQDGRRVVDTIVAVSRDGRAPKNDAALFALAMCAKLGNEQTRAYANSKVPEVARIGTHLLHYAAFVDQFGGWGRGTVRSFQRWFDEKTPDSIAYQAVKYANRDGWTMADVLRLSHPKPITNEYNAVYKYIVDGYQGDEPVPAILTGTELIKQGEVTAKIAAKLIREYNLPREVVPTQFLNDKVVWQALLEGMGVTAMIRNLGKMTEIGLLDGSLSTETKKVVDTIGNVDVLKKGRVHPMQVLVAMKTYASGQGLKGSLRWEPVRSIVDALDGAFYDTFQNVEPTGKNILLALDVSGSMSSGTVAGSPLSPREATAAMALITANVEKNYEIMGFTGGFIPLKISPSMRLDDVCKYTKNLPFERTDCAQPMLYAASKSWDIDAFVIYTDNETWAGGIHPTKALQNYRKVYNSGAKLVVVATTPTNFSIADPKDAGMLDVVGFDTATPAVIADFIRG